MSNVGDYFRSTIYSGKACISRRAPGQEGPRGSRFIGGVIRQPAGRLQGLGGLGEAEFGARHRSARVHQKLYIPLKVAGLTVSNSAHRCKVPGQAAPANFSWKLAKTPRSS